MKIYRHKKFKKAYQKLSPQLKERVNETLRQFIKNPYAKELHNHPLKGSMAGKRAIYAGFDLRIIFEEEYKYIVVYLIDVGTHNQVY